MEIFAPKKFVDCGIRIFLVILGKPPAGPTLVVTFGVRFYDRDIDKILETLEVPHKIGTVRERAEQALLKSVSRSEKERR